MGDTHFNFTVSNGNTLSGRLESPRANPRGWAIFAHCFTCGKDSLAASRISRALARDGIGVLRFDFAGLGRSEGDFGSSSFACNVADLLAAARAMEEAGMAPALLVGHSLGGSAVLAAAASIPSVQAVATLGAPADVAHILHQFDADALDEITRTGRASVRLSGRDFEFDRSFVEDVRQHDLPERIRVLRKPLLIMHAPGDRVVGIDNATQIFMAARHPKSFVSLDDADHLLTARKDADYAAGVIASWAARYLPEVVPDTAAPSEAPQDGVVHAEETGMGGYQVAIATRGHRLIADEPGSLGGLDSGMSPVELVSAALGACTVMTLRMYAERKNFPLESVATAVTHERQTGEDRPHLLFPSCHFEGASDGGPAALPGRNRQSLPGWKNSGAWREDRDQLCRIGRHRR